ncbi:MAG: chitobiase/beta-hexosaminidase C-terminal domain-containing protein [Bacteroidales bacterium]|nr:chitobiase/beta-hexosaminidase C-terminal domain-containing protein [Bacteroidales bacterium]
MKRILYSGLASLMMLLLMTGFVRAAAPQLSFSGISSDNKFGRYVPIVATLTVDGIPQQNFELYYCTGGGTPSKADYVPNEEEVTGIMRVVASGTTAEIMLTYGMLPYFKAIAYPANSQTASNLVELDLTAIEVEKLEFLPDAPLFGALEVDLNTVVKIIDNAGGSEIFYSTDGTTTPLKSAWEQNDPNVFKYNDATGIKITKAMTIMAIAFKEVNGLLAGSELLRGRFNLAKPTVRIAFSSNEYTIGEAAPTVNLTIPEGVTLGTQPGNLALQLSCQDNGFSQVITANGTALDMSKAIAADKEDDWTIRFSLVKGENPSAAFTGEVDLTPEVISLEIVKNGERPAVPVFSIPSGEVYKGTKVAITCATPGATIYYTTKDDEINVLYTDEITINSDCFIRAMAEKDGLSSYRTGVATASYTVAKTDPIPELTATVSPASGSQIPEGTEITVTPSVSVDKIYFKLYAKAADVDKDDNFNATATEYSATVKPVPTQEMPIVRVGLVKNQQWKYFSYVYSFQTTSDVPTAVTLTFNPVGGSTVDAGTAVSISAGNRNIDIFYMMFASLKEAEAAQWDQNQAHLYTDEMQPVLSMENTTVKATYSLDGETLADTFFYATYNVRELQPVELMFRPASGSIVEDGAEITVSVNSDAEIYYGVYADSMASVAVAATFIMDAKIISEDGKPVITKGNTFLKCGVFDNSQGTMKYFFASYRIKGEIELPTDTVEVPTFSLPSGEVAKGTKVALFCATEDAGIYYTLNGDEPMAISTPYRDSIVINKSMTIKAIALKAGMVKSKVAVATYTLKSVANETKVLAGVSIYPNPNDGQFQVRVPVDARMEVLTVDGQLVKRAALAAGANTLRLDNSGVYLVRVRANGQATIRKVVVR